MPGSPTLPPAVSAAPPAGTGGAASLLNQPPIFGLLLLGGCLLTLLLLALLFLHRQRQAKAEVSLSPSGSVLAARPSPPQVGYSSPADPLAFKARPGPQQARVQIAPEELLADDDLAGVPTHPLLGAVPPAHSSQAALGNPPRAEGVKQQEDSSGQVAIPGTSLEAYLPAESPVGEPSSPELRQPTAPSEQEPAGAPTDLLAEGLFSGRWLGTASQFGTYLGQGTCGVVYAAEQGDHQFKAIKLIHPRFLNRPRARKRFLVEAEHWTLLEHPSLVRVEAVGIAWNRGYLVLPYLGGGTLQERLRGPLPLESVWRYLEPLASALDYLHECQVLHLHLAPQNLLFDELNQPLLADAGLVPLLSQLAQEGGTRLSLPLSPYLAPEQVEGPGDQRSDLYALGVLLYQMIVGQVPPAGYSPLALLQHVLRATPSLRGQGPQRHLALAQVVVRPLARHPAERYQTAGELLDAFYTAARPPDGE